MSQFPKILNRFDLRCKILPHIIIIITLVKLNCPVPGLED